VDIGGHPPSPTGSKQFFWQFTIFSSFNFQGHFEGLNEGFSGSSQLNVPYDMIEALK
jgi:hypothetical protein